MPHNRAQCVHWNSFPRAKICEALVSIQRNYLIPVAMFLGTLLSATAQTAPINPALLAKANSGDATAQVAVGEQYAQAADSEHDKTQMAERLSAGAHVVPEGCRSE